MISKVVKTAIREKKDRPKAKRKKVPDKQMPRLMIFGLEQGGEVVECQLETAKHSFITFKFNRDDDQPAEIAENLVNLNLTLQYVQMFKNYTFVFAIISSDC